MIKNSTNNNINRIRIRIKIRNNSCTRFCEPKHSIMRVLFNPHYSVVWRIIDLEDFDLFGKF